MPVVTRFFFLLALSLTIYPTQAEYGKGFVASEMDPTTHEFKPVYKDWQEGVVFDSASGNYTITYKDEDGEYNEVIFEPSTKIEPVLKSEFKEKRDLVIRYEYKLKNGGGAKQPIDELSTFVSNLNPNNPIDPAAWYGAAMPGVLPPFLKLHWSYIGKDRQEVMSEGVKGLLPGRSENRFALESNDLPGIAVMEIRGRPISRLIWLGQAPEFYSPIGQEVAKLKANNFVPRLAAVPLIPVGTPYDGTAVLDALRIHVTKDLVELKLIEPILASQLDRSIQAAADAIRRNSLNAARDHLHDAFELVHKAHPDLDKDDWNDEEGMDAKRKAQSVHPIDRLAARVIAFDLKYVEKRLKDEQAGH